MQFSYIQNTNNHVQASLTSWYADYPSAANFLLGSFGCTAFHPGSDSVTQHHRLLQTRPSTPSIAAGTLNDDPTAFAAADRALTDAAIAIALLNPRYVDIVSRRVEDYAYHEVFHWLIDQADSPLTSSVLRRPPSFVIARRAAPRQSIGTNRPMVRHLRPIRLIALALLLAIVTSAALAPLYAGRISGTDPFLSTPMATGRSGAPRPRRQSRPRRRPGPSVSPAWDRPHLARPSYLLGADTLGRDGRGPAALRRPHLLASSPSAATLLCLTCSAPSPASPPASSPRPGITLIDTSISALIDLLWAFPVYLLAISLSVVLVTEGLHLGPLTLEADNPLLPILIIGIVYIPYVARPVRAETLGLRTREYIEAAVATGSTPLRILTRHLFPALIPTLTSLLPILAAMSLLTEAALSILGLGIQPPSASWGTLLADGQSLLYTRPVVALAPGLAIALTVLSLNLLTDQTR